MDEHIGRFNADADNLPNHSVRPDLRLVLQSFVTSFLDLPEPADHKAQPRHVALQLGQDIWRQRHALRGVIGAGGFQSVRRATETPFNKVLKARP